MCYALEEREQMSRMSKCIYRTEHIACDSDSTEKLPHIQTPREGNKALGNPRNSTVSPEPTAQTGKWTKQSGTSLPSCSLAVLSPGPQHILAGHNVLFQYRFFFHFFFYNHSCSIMFLSCFPMGGGEKAENSCGLLENEGQLVLCSFVVLPSVCGVGEGG